MKKRNPFTVFILGLITFGIYDLYWLVQTKKVLNEKTRYRTPTIWLLILPSVVLIAGYILLFASGFSSSTSSSSSSTSGGPTPLTSSGNSSSASSSVAPGEQLSTQGARRPTQYVHICTTASGIQYVSQGSPKCLGSDTYQGDYDSSVPGTLFSSPCKTTGGTTRYVYISQSESCPSGTSSVFYNNLCPANATTNLDCTTPGNSSQNGQIAHPGMFFAGLGLIIVGFIATFSITIFWFFRFSKAVDEYTQGKMSTAISFLILWLVHLVGVALIQDTFNDMADAGPTFNQPLPAGVGGPVSSAPGPTFPEPGAPASGMPPAPIPVAPAPFTPPPAPTPPSEPPVAGIHPGSNNSSDNGPGLS